MTRYRLITVPTGQPTLHGACCHLLDEREHTDLETAQVAAECMLSVLDFAYGASTHEIRIHLWDGVGGHATEPSAIAKS